MQLLAITCKMNIIKYQKVVLPELYLSEDVALWIKSLPNVTLSFIINSSISSSMNIYNHLKNDNESKGYSDISSIKGAQGEEYVFKAIEKKFNISNTSKISRCGDFQIQLAGDTY